MAAQLWLPFISMKDSTCQRCDYLQGPEARHSQIKIVAGYSLAAQGLTSCSAMIFMEHSKRCAAAAECIECRGLIHMRLGSSIASRPLCVNIYVLLEQQQSSQDLGIWPSEDHHNKVMMDLSNLTSLYFFPTNLSASRQLVLFGARM